ncbi:MAG: LysE family transporter [Alphaproteobacteria bacterium]|nr:LysE family transporter [Alphaproteobacteria bacterium]
MQAVLDQLWAHRGAIAGIAGLFALAVVTPGPNFLAVTHHAVTRSRRDALAVVAGIGVATTLWIVACVLGLGVLLERAPWLRIGLQWLGAAYLVWTGIGLIRSALRAPGARAEAPVSAAFRRAKRWLDLATGGAFTLLGLRLAADR